MRLTGRVAELYWSSGASRAVIFYESHTEEKLHSWKHRISNFSGAFWRGSYSLREVGQRKFGGRMPFDHDTGFSSERIFFPEEQTAMRALAGC